VRAGGDADIHVLRSLASIDKQALGVLYHLQAGIVLRSACVCSEWRGCALAIPHIRIGHIRHLAGLADESQFMREKLWSRVLSSVVRELCGGICTPLGCGWRVARAVNGAICAYCPSHLSI
jgi:hypothetical protein